MLSSCKTKDHEKQTLPQPSQPPIITFESSRLRYRTVQMSDLQAVKAIISRKEAMQWTSRAPITTHQEAEEWLHDRALGPNIYNFAVLLKHKQNADQKHKPDELIGLLGILRHPEIGYMFHPDHFGKGYATEALQTMLPRLRHQIHSSTDASGKPYAYIEAQTDAENAASRRLLERCGFTLVELRPDDFLNPMLGNRDTAVYRYLE